MLLQLHVLLKCEVFVLKSNLMHYLCLILIVAIAYLKNCIKKN